MMSEQRLRILGILQHMALGPWRAGRIEIDRTRLRIALEDRPVGCKAPAQARPHDETILRQPDRRLEQFHPWQLAVLLVRQLQHRDQRRCSDGSAARLRQIEGQGFAINEEHVRRCAGWRPLATVIGIDRSIAISIVDQEAAAAHAGRFRLHQSERHLNRDGCIDSAATLP
jgi:hypothetical protein